MIASLDIEPSTIKAQSFSNIGNDLLAIGIASVGKINEPRLKDTRLSNIPHQIKLFLAQLLSLNNLNLQIILLCKFLTFLLHEFSIRLVSALVSDLPHIVSAMCHFDYSRLPGNAWLDVELPTLKLSWFKRFITEFVV